MIVERKLFIDGYCSSVQGSYKFFSLPPSNTTPQWLLRVGATKVQGFMKGYLVDSNLLSIWAEVNSKLLHCLQSQGVSLTSHTNSQEERRGPARLGC